MRMNLGRIGSLDAGQIEALPDYVDLEDFDPPSASSTKASEPSASVSKNEPENTSQVPFSSTITWQSKESTTASTAASTPDRTFSSLERIGWEQTRQKPQQWANNRVQRIHIPATAQRSNAMMTCPKCGKTMKEHELPEHFQAEHKGKDSGISRTPPVVKIAQQPHTGIDDDDEYAFLEGDIETITDEFYDQRYGDKYVGQSWPESSGIYGSIPLYDDYGDEGEA